MNRLKVDYIDLWQMRGLTNPAGREKAMGPDGALEAFSEACDQGLVRFLGVTGHGIKVPGMHRLSLERFEINALRAREERLEWFRTQCIKESSTLRASPKRQKASPRIVYRYGKQDKMINNFLDY